MSTVNVLFELGVEEMPASAVKNFPGQLEALISTGLKNNGLDYTDLKIYMTPRRIAVYIKNLLAEQPERIVEKQGPQEKVAFNEKGEPTAAALGFARSNNIEPAQLKNHLENGRLFYRHVQKGLHAEQLLPELFSTAIGGLQAGRTMHWNNGISFVRPIRWVVLLVENKLLEAKLFGLKTQNFTYGHRFMAPEKIIIKHADNYVTQLEQEGKVLVDQNVRRKKITQQLQLPLKYAENSIPTEFSSTLNLIDEVNGLVEWPVALCGKFSERFLNIPKEVLISSMKTHQKCFSFYDEHEKLLPYFIAISNIESKNTEQVTQGYERVMHARLSDAAFFFKTDQQQPLSQRLTALSNILYHEKLGSLYDKTQRVIILCEKLAKEFSFSTDDCTRAARLSLCDLNSLMVQEFPELQGVIGSYYAKHDGESDDVSTALIEQYLPAFSGDRVPDSLIGYTLAIAQRLDTLVGQFSAGNKPSGDKDPFALRRQAQGLMRILVENKIDLDVPTWLEQTLSLMPIKPEHPQELLQDLWKFCLDRLRAEYLEKAATHTSVFNAVSALVLNASSNADDSTLKPTSPYDFTLRLKAVEDFLKLPDASALIAAHKRVKNILNKAKDIPPETAVKSGLLREVAEQDLAEEISKRVHTIQTLPHLRPQERHYDILLTELAGLRPFIDNFFDHVMVMVDDPALRDNRLILLKQLRKYLECVADISEL